MILENVAKVKERIVCACRTYRRLPDEVRLVAVVKNQSAEKIEEILQAGIFDLGENKVQEAKEHAALLAKLEYFPAIRWHLIGHLQTNKVRDAVGLFSLIHSVDSLRLAQEINRQAQRIDKVQDILLEVKTSNEESKFGLAPTELKPLLEQLSGLKNIRALGLMTIAPLGNTAEAARPYFRTLADLRNKLYGECASLRELSMGMSDDFSAAIAEGATIVRIGRALF